MTPDSSRPRSADVVVIGGGGSGLATAVRAAELGHTVIVLEKNEELGGTTRLSIGSFSANGTNLQRRAGISDSPDEHFEDMGKFAGDLVQRDNLSLRRLYVDHSAEALEWVQHLGVQMFGPMPEPPHRFARMHNVLPNSYAYIYWLERAARKLGVEIVTGASAKSLHVVDGRVRGVVVACGDDEWLVEGQAGVVLAAGDFSSSQEIKSGHLTSDKAAKVPGINPASTGDGLSMGMSVGGRIVNGDLGGGVELRFVAPSRRLLLQRLPPWKAVARTMQFALRWMPDVIQRPFIMAFATAYLAPAGTIYEHGAVLVNRRGNRFTDELDQPHLDVPDQPGAEAFIVMNRATSRDFEAWPNFISTAPGVAYAYLGDYRRNRKDIYTSARSTSELATKLGMDRTALQGAVPEDDPDGLVALGPLKSWVVITEGGLAIDTAMRVLDDEDRPIAGLFAVGSNGQGGLLLEGHGNHVGWAIISGRLASESIHRLTTVDASRR